MRRPRVEDYDPNAKLPELASSLDGMPVIGKPPQKSKAASPPLLSEKLFIQEEQVKKVKQKGTLSPVQPLEVNKRPVKPRHGFDSIGINMKPSLSGLMKKNSKVVLAV